MKKLFLIPLLFLCTALFAQQEKYIKMSLVTNVDTLIIPEGRTVNYQLTISGQKKCAIRSVTISNYKGVYTIDRNIQVEAFLSFTGAKFEILLINKLPVVVVTLPALPKTDWIYCKKI